MFAVDAQERGCCIHAISDRKVRGVHHGQEEVPRTKARIVVGVGRGLRALSLGELISVCHINPPGPWAARYGAGARCK